MCHVSFKRSAAIWRVVQDPSAILGIQAVHICCLVPERCLSVRHAGCLEDRSSRKVRSPVPPCCKGCQVLHLRASYPSSKKPAVYDIKGSRSGVQSQHASKTGSFPGLAVLSQINQQEPGKTVVTGSREALDQQKGIVAQPEESRRAMRNTAMPGHALRCSN